VEALRPLPAFAIIAFVQKTEKKDANFWLGSALVLVSAIGFQLSRKRCRDTRTNETRQLTTKERSPTESTETSFLLGIGKFDEPTIPLV